MPRRTCKKALYYTRHVPIRYFIIGFPRTATTAVYNLLTRVFPDDKGYLHIFEPFNGEVMYNVKSFGFIRHDKEGKIHHDYHRLREDILETIFENSYWFWNWALNDVPTMPYLGNWQKIIEILDGLDSNVIVKDVDIWVMLKELVKKLPHTKFIILLRGEDAVTRDLAKWYRQRGFSTNRERLKFILENLVDCAKLVLRLHKLATFLRYKRALQHPRALYGICLAYRYFRGVFNYPKICDETVFEEVVRAVYREYVNMVNAVLDSENVVVIKYDQYLDLNTVLHYLASS